MCNRPHMDALGPPLMGVVQGFESDNNNDVG